MDGGECWSLKVFRDCGIDVNKFCIVVCEVERGIGKGGIMDFIRVVFV